MYLPLVIKSDKHLKLEAVSGAPISQRKTGCASDTQTVKNLQVQSSLACTQIGVLILISVN